MHKYTANEYQTVSKMIIRNSNVGSEQDEEKDILSVDSDDLDSVRPSNDY